MVKDINEWRELLEKDIKIKANEKQKVTLLEEQKDDEDQTIKILEQSLKEILEEKNPVLQDIKLKSLSLKFGYPESSLRRILNRLEQEKKKEKEELIMIHEQEEKEDKKKKIQEHYNTLSETKKLKSDCISLIHQSNYNDVSELLVSHIKRKNHIYTTKNDEKSEVWIYEDGIYIPNGKSEIQKQLREILDEWYSSFIFNIVLSKIRADTFIEENIFFKNNYINEIPVKNGILNIDTRILYPFNPKKIFFSKIPVAYNPKSKCDKIDKFLSEVLSNETDKQVFYELGGFGLLKEYRWEKAFMFHGFGRNGKSKSIELLKRFFGLDNCAAISLSALTPDSFEVSELFSKMLNLAGDISSRDLKDASTFKSLTGRDLQSAKRKFLTSIHFENYCKLVFSCNELPFVTDTSLGFWSRWILLDFPYTFVDDNEFNSYSNEERIAKKIKLRNPNIINEITSEIELSGLLNRFLDAYDTLKKNNRFSTTTGTEAIKNIWIRKSNSFIAFCLDRIEEDYNSLITKQELRSEYNKYCKKHKLKIKTDYWIKTILQEQFAAEDFRSSSNFGDDRPSSWKGVKWKSIK